MHCWVLLQAEALQTALQLREEEVVHPSQVQIDTRPLVGPCRGRQRPVVADSEYFAADKYPTFWLFILL
jgi:hypothetical protein